MVTAKGTEIDTVVALEVGADDYVTKPYRLRELVARMRAVLRRAPGGPEASDSRPPSSSAATASGSPTGSRWTSTSGASSCAARRSTCAARSSSCCACWSRTPAGS